MQRPAAGLLRLAAVVLAALAAGSGCVAFNVGKAEVVARKTATKTETVRVPMSVTVEAATGKLRQVDNCAVASIHAHVREKYKKSIWEETTITRHQKRLAIGFFPGAAEICAMPDGALLWDQSLGDYVLGTIPINIGSLGTATICSLVVAPFAPWECSHRRRRGKAPFRNGGTGYDVGLDALAEKLMHFGLLGCNKHLAVFEETIDGPKRTEEIALDRQLEVNGCYEVEFGIPSLGYAKTEWVQADATNAVFELPQVEHGGNYEAAATFRLAEISISSRPPQRPRFSSRSLSPEREENELAKQALAMMDTRTVRTNVWLQGRPNPKAVHGQPQPVVREVVREIVREIPVERKPEGAPYNVEKTSDGSGRTVWRVGIQQEHLNAFSVDGEVKPRILQELRDDFAGRNPGVRREEINAWAAYTTENGGRTLVYQGEASSLIPELIDLKYDSRSRRGVVTMRPVAGADLRQTKEVARRNISAIVCDKNVALTDGERPPDGAQYKSLDENFADGVLTVEFEALE